MKKIDNISGIEIFDIVTHSDERGELLKLMDVDFSKMFTFDEIYLVTSKLNQIRGNHFHKSTTEWFIVVKGKALFRFHNILTKENMEIIISFNDKVKIQVSPNVAHSFINFEDEELIVLAIADKIYKKKNPDQYYYNLGSFSNK